MNDPVATIEVGPNNLLEKSASKVEEAATEVFSVEDFFNAVRYGSRTHISFILDKDCSLVNKLDSQGFSCIHWAAKRGDYEILSQLSECGAKLDTPASYETQMCPVHWAASEGKLKSIKFFLDSRQDLNVTDANGCSALIIATQYGKIETVVYLIKNGADLTQRDTNGDTALHWAAYKGFEEITGLLLHFAPLHLNSEDQFGQTPLHLAALRGNFDVVHYLISDFGADVVKRDKNGFTPLELSMKKEQFKAEWVIRRLTSSNTLDLLSRLGIGRLRDARVLLFLFIGSNDNEVTAWVWRCSFVSNFIATYITIGYTTSTVLSDYPYLHVANTMIQCLWWLFFILVLIKSPGYVVQECVDSSRYKNNNKKYSNSNNKQFMYSQVSTTDSSNNSDNSSKYHPHSYDAALEIMGSDVAVEASATGAHHLVPAVCHTCRVQKPLRSKHCKFQRQCVIKFDHFCPYVYNTIGRDNYFYFVSILFIHNIAFLMFAFTSICYWMRASVSVLFIVFFIYAFMMFLAITALSSYHLRLLFKNMSTNEDVNAYRYRYFRDSFNAHSNPFDKGSAWKNSMDALFPDITTTSKLYYTREEVLKDKNKGAFSSTSSSVKAGACCDSNKKLAAVDLEEQQQLCDPVEDHEVGYFEESKIKAYV